MKQPAHIKCPLVHCGGKKKKKLRHQSKKVQGESKEEVYIMVDDEWAEAQGRNV